MHTDSASGGLFLQTQLEDVRPDPLGYNSSSETSWHRNCIYDHSFHCI